MKERLLNNWNIHRVLYLILGLFILTDSIIDLEWIGIILGTYIGSMGLFALGCASNNCMGGSCAANENKKLES